MGENMHGWLGMLGLPYLKGAPKPFRTTRGPTLQEVKPTIKRIVPWSSWSEKPYTKTAFRLYCIKNLSRKKKRGLRLPWPMANKEVVTWYIFLYAHQTKITKKGHPSSLLSKQSSAGSTHQNHPPKTGRFTAPPGRRVPLPFLQEA